jgi:hypothetical protein
MDAVGTFSSENSKLKKVAGYNCRKGKVSAGGISSTVYYSTAFNSPTKNIWRLLRSPWSLVRTGFEQGREYSNPSNKKTF